VRASIVVILAAIVGAATARWSLAPRPYEPKQPIDFSHRVHVGDDELDCELCHSAVRRSPFAGIAPVERCMGCHKYVRTANPDVTELRRLWDARKTISWVKVYTLPQYVRFSHEAHVLAQVSCAACHGDVASMDRVRRVIEPTMGWCVQCHRESRAPDDCLTCHY
jgi:hypothetical protein